MNNPHYVSPSSLKSRFTTRFLRALNKIRAQKSLSTSSPAEIFLQYRKIKVEADKSMAYSVRSTRIWSRVVLWKLRRRCSGRRPVKISTIMKSRQAIMKKARHDQKQSKINTTTRGKDQDGVVGFGFEADGLRELVPGGEAMNLCNLLDETAHYIKCLNTQVQVMKKIADFYSL